MSKYLNPKVDLTFKKVFGEHPNLVKSLLNALLPLPEGMDIVKVEYLTNESVPNNPIKYLSFIDIRCTDNKDRVFIVEIQSYWNMESFSRRFFTSTSKYFKQLPEGNIFDNLNDVYGLAFITDDAFDYKGGGDYMQEFYIANKNHPDDRRNYLAQILVEIKNYKPTDRGSRAIKDLWLRFLTEIDENTKIVDEVMSDNPDISQALKIVERSAYSDAELYKYNDYLLEVMTYHNALKNEREEGFAEGRAQGIAECIAQGKRQTTIEIARKFKAANIPITIISQNTGLTEQEIINLS